MFTMVMNARFLPPCDEDDAPKQVKIIVIGNSN
jgi:hypothetical protein